VSAGARVGYAFDNDDAAAVHRHRYLAAMLDSGTFRRIMGLGPLAGARCLEVGAGGGSVAGWLAARGAQVLATDLNPRHLRTDEGYEIRRHDVVTQPVPDGPWDLIHARLLLAHLPQRVEVLHRLAAALAPGGALLVEEWATQYREVVLAAPDRDSRDLVERYVEALITRILAGVGNDSTWAARMHGTMVTAGLVDVRTTVRADSWPGGTAGALLMAVNVDQQRAAFLADGFTAAELARLEELARDPRLVVRGHFLYATSGRRP
jgi:SAM-dependent methyltransferase